MPDNGRNVIRLQVSFETGQPEPASQPRFLRPTRERFPVTPSGNRPDRCRVKFRSIRALLSLLQLRFDGFNRGYRRSRHNRLSRVTPEIAWNYGEFLFRSYLL